MIGQDILINKINILTLDNFPKSLILLGSEGSGKHLIFDLIRNKLGIPYFDITNSISRNTIDEIYLKVEPTLYLIEIDLVTTKEENMLLKLVEEPLDNAYIIFIAKNKSTIISTILNRCQIWELQQYSEDQLRYFLSTKYDNYPDYFKFLEFCDTPGQLLSMIDNNYDIPSMIELANKIIDHISTARFSNTLTLSNKFSFNNETDKLNLDIFIKVFNIQIKKRFLNDSNLKYFNGFKVLNQLQRDLQIPHINKKQLFENCLFVLSRVLR